MSMSCRSLFAGVSVVLLGSTEPGQCFPVAMRAYRIDFKRPVGGHQVGSL